MLRLYIAFLGLLGSSFSENTSKLPSPPACGTTELPPTKVTGVQNAESGQWPWTVVLGFEGHNEHRWLCGGFLITDRYVLTAGHCLKSKQKLVTVRLGDNDLTSDNDGVTPLDAGIESTTVHEGFVVKHSESTGGTNNIALIKLDKPVSFSKTIRPICLPTTAELRKNKFVGKSAVVAGWGRTEFGGPTVLQQQQVETVIVENESCKNTYVNKTIIKEDQICAESTTVGKDACSGFSGSALAVEDKNVYYGVGISILGYGCGVKGYPGVYLRISDYIDWIEKNMS